MYVFYIHVLNFHGIVDYVSISVMACHNFRDISYIEKKPQTMLWFGEERERESKKKAKESLGSALKIVWKQHNAKDFHYV